MTTSSTKRTYRFVNDYGVIFRMTERNYLKYIKASVKALRAGKEALEPGKYGKEIGTLSFTSTDAKLIDFEWAR